MPLNPDVLKKLTLEGATSVAGADRAFIYHAVGPLMTLPGARNFKEEATTYMLANPAEDVQKKFAVKSYQLVVVGPAIYWRIAKPAPKLNLGPLTRGDEIPPGTIAELTPDSDWFQVGSTGPTAIQENKDYLTANSAERPTKQVERQT